LNKLLPFFVWLVALGTLVGAAQELRRQRDTSDTSAALAAVPQFKVKSKALGLKDYQAIQKKMAVFGSVEILPGPTALTVKAAALSDYAAWRLTLDQVLLDSPGVSWRIDSLCSGKCASGETHHAVLVGNRVSGVVEEKVSPDMPSATTMTGKASSSG
jgi:hypothetical protein